MLFLPPSYTPKKTSEKNTTKNIIPNTYNDIHDNLGTDEHIWNHVDLAIVEITPPRRAIASSLQQPPWLQNTGSFGSSSEYRQDVDRVLKSELGSRISAQRFLEISMVFKQHPMLYSKDAQKVAMLFLPMGEKVGQNMQIKRRS